MIEGVTRLFNRVCFVALTVLALGSCSSSEPTAPLPEPEPPPTLFFFDALYAGNVAAGKSRELRIAVPIATLLRFSLQTQSGSVADTLIATVFDPAQNDTLGVLTSAGNQPELESVTLFIDPLASPAELRVSVRGNRASLASTFQAIMRSPSQQPERISSLIAYGDTIIGESLDGLRDLDRLFFNGQAGDDVIVYVSIPVTRNGSLILARIVSDVNVILGGIGYNAVAGTLEERSAGARLTSTGVHYVEVSGSRIEEGFFPLGYVGPYQLWLHRLNRRPETAPQVLTIGDTITEQLDVVGDIDEYRFTVPAGQQLVYNLAIETALPKGIRVELDGQTILDPEITNTAVPTLNTLGSGIWFAPNAGEHTLRVTGPSQTTKALGTTTYRLELYQPLSPPESAPASIALGDTVRAERINRPGDLDVFRIPLDSGQIIDMFLAAPQLLPSEEICLRLIAPSAEEREVMCLQREQERAVNSSALTLTQSGMYEVHVQGERAFDVPYEFSVVAVNPAPEQVSAVLPFNTWVSENLFPTSDLDFFRFDARPDRGYALWLKVADDSETRLRINTSVDQVAAIAPIGFTGNFVTDSGRVDVLVQTLFSGFRIPTPLPYQLWVSEFLFGPEQADSVVTAGVTVTGESLDVIGDIDEFYFDVAANARYRFTFTVPAGASPPQVVFEVQRALDGGFVAQEQLLSAGTISTDLVASATNATMRIRVRGATNGSAPNEIGAYTIRIAPIP